LDLWRDVTDSSGGEIDISRLAYKKRLYVIFEAILLMVALQGITEISELYISSFFPRTRLNERIINISIMIVLTVVLILYAKIRKQALSFFPEKISKGYIIATCAAAVVFIIAPSNFTQGFTSVINILYGSIVTPVYEELLFRGYLWNRFGKVMTNRWHICIWNVALFTIWHFLYIVPNIISGDWNVLQLLKIVAGLFYGTILGFIRLKTKNCWATILAHGIMNFFMI